MNSGPGSSLDTLRAAAHARPGAASPIDRYFRGIEHTAERGALDRAVTLAAALPQICSVLEQPDLRSSPARYIRWCEAWLEESVSTEVQEPVTGTFLYHLHTAGVIPRQLGCATREEFKQLVCRVLIEAARRWYRQRGADDPAVQRNLGRSALVGSGVRRREVIAITEGD